ncbi:MAG: AbrB/MazE/SpoVT family DNA-binding domain-containing protein [Patescibacteria group bacterium]|nr:AbrB/MazE/SpoVT family DNA-binding domain-containing protein [Patescibacteria group bacterium]
MEIETKTRRWGSSLGVIIPKELVKEERLQEGQEIRIDILSRKKTTGADIFGKLKFKKPVQVLLDETDKDFEPAE